VGLDCGGSSCRALAVDSDGAVLHRGQSGAANLASTPEAVLSGSLRKALRGCPDASYVCGCFAGLLTQEDRERAEALLRENCPGAVVRAEPDYAAALTACPDRTDICVIAGTGSLICSRSGSGFAKSGGRGFVMGDYGSAFRYGREFLRYHLEERTLESIADQLIEVFGIGDEAGVLAKLYRSGEVASKLAKLAYGFARATQAGEPSALDFLREETVRLAQQVVTHAERFLGDNREISICLAGGLWKISPIFEREFKGRLNEISGGRSILLNRIKRAPVEGAIILAKEMLL